MGLFGSSAVALRLWRTYCVPVEHDTWPKRLNAIIGREVQRYRKRRPYTAEQLSERCAELGLPISRSKIANLENGRARQEGISLAELMVIAAALDVPPALLVFPVRSQDDMEMLPGNPATPWVAYRWFTGDEPLSRYVPGEPGRAVFAPPGDDPVRRWADNRYALELLTEHGDRVRTSVMERNELSTGSGDEERARRALVDLARTRDLMRRSGVTPPELTADLAAAVQPLESVEAQYRYPANVREFYAALGDETKTAMREEGGEE